jgi:DNA-binding IscR family transcriptional regulator
MRLNLDFTMAVETIQFLKKNKSNDYITAEEIAEALDLSIGYLQKTMQILSTQGLVECKRGRIGGARLRKRKVTLLDIWNVTTGRIDTDPPLSVLKKPLKAFADALKNVVICK